MSTAELKADLCARIESMDESRLAALEKVLLTLEAEELDARIDEGFDAARQAGLLMPEKIQSALDQFRAAHPYR